MGSDIHMYIQYADKEHLKECKKNGKDPWWGNFGSEMGPGRDYGMFGILAGVRRYQPENKNKMFEPKGIPDFGLGWPAREDLYLTIDNDGVSGDGTCTLEDAVRWGRKIINDSNGKPYKTLHPDWHSHSWLTVDEYEQAIHWYKSSHKYDPEVKWIAILKAMKALEDGGKNEVVLVFWFDN